MVKGTVNYLLVTIQIIRPWRTFALSEYIECDDCLWIVGGKGVSRRLSD